MAQKKKIIRSTIKENKNIGADHFIMKIKESHLSKSALPGQFVNIRIGEAGLQDQLLRIPLGIYRTRKNETSFLYKVVGTGTQMLSRKRKGETLDILGPLGKGFDTGEDKKKEKVLIVAGGHGIAPLYGLAEELSSKKIEVTFFIGACGKKHIVCTKEIRKLGAKIQLATEDGSCGYKGYVTEALENYLKPSTIHHPPSTIYACGPKPMLKEIARISKKHKIPAQVSLDEYMACGIGACLGCAVKTKTGYKLVCKDGPVFDAQEIIW